MEDYFMWWGPGGLLSNERAGAPTYVAYGVEPWSPASDPPTVGLYFPENARYMMLGAQADEVAK